MRVRIVNPAWMTPRVVPHLTSSTPAIRYGGRVALPVALRGAVCLN